MLLKHPDKNVNTLNTNSCKYYVKLVGVKLTFSFVVDHQQQ